jgi:hypothetical protein
VQNSAGAGSLEFYKKRFEIENHLTRNILKTIRRTGSNIDRMNVLLRPVKLPGLLSEGCTYASIWPVRRQATLFSIPIRVSQKQLSASRTCQAGTPHNCHASRQTDGQEPGSYECATRLRSSSP